MDKLKIPSGNEKTTGDTVSFNLAWYHWNIAFEVCVFLRDGNKQNISEIIWKVTLSENNGFISIPRSRVRLCFER